MTLPRELRGRMMRDLELWRFDGELACRCLEALTRGAELALTNIQRQTSIKQAREAVQSTIQHLDRSAREHREKHETRWADFAAMQELWMKTYFDCRDYQI